MNRRLGYKYNPSYLSPPLLSLCKISPMVIWSGLSVCFVFYILPPLTPSHFPLVVPPVRTSAIS